MLSSQLGRVHASRQQDSKQLDHHRTYLGTTLLRPKPRLGRPCFANPFKILSKIANSIFQIIKKSNVYRHWDDLKFMIPLQTLPRDDGTTLAGSVSPLSKNFGVNFVES